MTEAGAGDATSAGPVSDWTPTPGQRVFPGTVGGPRTVVAVDTSGGRRFVTGGQDGTIRFWDPGTARQVGESWAAHAFGVYALLATSGPDGRTLLASASGPNAETGTPDDVYRLWDLATGAAVGAVAATGDVPVDRLAALDDGRLVAMYEGTVTVSDGTRFDVGDACALAVVPAVAGGGPLVAVAQEVGVTFRDPGAGEPVGPELAVSAQVLAAVAGPGGRTLLATGDRSGAVRLWDPDTREPAGGPYQGGTDPVRALATVVLTDGTVLLAAGDEAGAVHVWDVATGVPGPVLSTGAWIQDMTGLGDGTPRLAVATGTGLFVTDCLTGAHVQSPPSGCAEQVQSLAAGRLAADGWAFAAGSDDDHDAGWLSLFDGTGYPVRRPVPAHPDDCGALVFLPTPRGVVLVSGGGAEVRFWDPATLEPAETPLPLREPDRLDEYWVLGLAVVRDDSRALLAVGDSDGIVRLWDPVAWRPVTEIETRHGIDALHAVPRRTGGDLVAVSRFGRGVHVWDPRTGVLVGDIEQAGRADVVAAVPAGPDGHHWIASGDEKQGIVVLWEPDGTFVRQIHTRWPPSAIAGLLRADGTPLLVTGHAGGGMVVWDATAGQRLHDLTGHLDHVMALLAVPDGPDGPEVLSASNDGTIRRWPLAVLTGCSPGGATAELV